MRILVNHSAEDRVYLQNLTFILKEHGLAGVATARTYDITTLQEVSKKANCEAILISNQETLKICLGEKATLDKYRGTRINYSIPAIVVNPIEHIHTVTHGKFLLNSDLRKFKRIKDPIVPFNFLVCDTKEKQYAAENFLNACEIISFDIETDSALQITCISFTGLHSRGSVASFILPLVDFDEIHYRTEDDLAAAVQFMQRILGNDVPKLAFNGIYDTQYCIRYHAYPNVYLLDAMILSWSKYSELPRALDFCCSIYLYDYFFWKDESDKAKNSKDIRGYWAYCVKDSFNTLRLFLELSNSLTHSQIHNYQRTFRLSYPFLYCAFEGIKDNEKVRADFKAEKEKARAQKLKDLQAMSANPNFNPGSWQQVHQFVYEIIGAKKPDKIKGAGTDAKALNRVAMQHPLLARICDLIITYREEAKAISQYCEYTTLNGRLLYNIDPTGAETGRASSKASNFWVGTQIQNIPSYAKNYLEADEGFELIEADKNKAEARCVAYLSQCEELIADLEGSRDFYKVVTERFFHIPYDQVTKAMRNDVTKHIIHGTHHCMGPDPFIDTATPKKIYEAMAMLNWKKGSMEDFVKYLLSLYHRDYKRVRIFWKEDVKDKIQLDHRTVSPIGWTRYFFGDINKSHKIFREAVAHQSQNLNVDILNEEMWNIYNELVIPSNGDLRFKAQIHDSLFFQARSSKLEFYTKEIHRLMTQKKITVHGREMKIPVDVKVGKVWGQMKEVSFV